MRISCFLLMTSLVVGNVAQAKAGGSFSKLRASVRSFFLPSEGSYSGLQQRVAAIAIATASCGVLGCCTGAGVVGKLIAVSLLSKSLKQVEEGLPVTPRWEAIEYMTEQQRDRYDSIMEENDTRGVAMEKSGDYYIFYFGDLVVLRGDEYIEFTHWIDFDGEVHALPISNQFYARIPPDY